MSTQHHLIPDLNPPQQFGTITEEEPMSNLTALFFQVLSTLLLALLIYICSLDWKWIIHKLCPSQSTRPSLKPIGKDYTGYRNYDPKMHDNREVLYPGNPSEWYEPIHVPFFRQIVLNQKHNVSEQNIKNEYYIALGGKVFDVSDGTLCNEIIQCKGVKLPLLYGQDLSLAASKGIYNETTINKPLNIDILTPDERVNFYRIYNIIYNRYPIVGTFEGEEIYVKLLKDRMKFRKSDFFW
jgi:predicted heme/steroid binding protein